MAQTAASSAAAASCPDARPAFALPHWVEITRAAWGPAGDALMQKHIEEGKPLILSRSKVVPWDKYADDAQLRAMLSKRDVGVKLSPNQRFRYFNMEKRRGNFAFTAPTYNVKMPYSAFEKLLKGNASEDPPAGSTEETQQARVYLQESLNGREDLASEFATWDWRWILNLVVTHRWGHPDDCQLWVGSVGAESPLHFDEAENIFVQIRGRKRVILFQVEDYLRCYPFPYGHPCDRHSLVNVPRFDEDEFPNFCDARGHYAMLEDGDALYLPYGWWHYFRNEDNGAASISFWFNAAPLDTKDAAFRIDDRMLMRVRRNIEKLVVDSLTTQGKEPTTVMPRFLKSLKSEASDPELTELFTIVSSLLEAISIPADERRKFLLDILDTRWEVDWSYYI